MRIDFTTPSTRVKVMGDRVVLYTMELKRSEGVEVPMSHCILSSFSRSIDRDDYVTLAFSVDGGLLYGSDDASKFDVNYVTIPVGRIEEAAFGDDSISCRCANADLRVGVLEIMSAIEDVNDRYMRAHDDDPAVIRAASMTMCLAHKAREIIGRRHDETKVYVPVPKD